MEGLLPYLIQVIKDKNQNPQNKYRSHSVSEGSRSYHLLLGSDSFSGSSHRRTRSDFQLPTTIGELSEQRTGFDGNGIKLTPRGYGYDYTASTPRSDAGAQASHNSNNTRN